MKLVLCFITWVNAEGAQNNAFKNALSGTPIISGPLSDYASLLISNGKISNTIWTLKTKYQLFKIYFTKGVWKITWKIWKLKFFTIFSIELTSYWKWKINWNSFLYVSVVCNKNQCIKSEQYFISIVDP